MEIKSADEFYSVMGILSQEMLDDKLLDTEDLIKVCLIFTFQLIITKLKIN